jgi:aldehyde:ferredoxin oxidoreductase
MTAIFDDAYSKEGPALGAARSLGVTTGPLPASDLSPEKVALAKAIHLSRLFSDSLISCHLVPWQMKQHVEIVQAVTGWDFTVLEAMKVGERVATMGRAFNMREGLTAEDDWLPKRFFGPTPRGTLKDTALDREVMENGLHTFYTMMGWDRETGVPTTERLAELGIGWVEEELGFLAAAH